MLANLRISNIALIDKLELTFENGFDCFTGETGAGKSIIIDAIGAVLGSRSSRELIRSGAESGRIEAFFTCISDLTRRKMSELEISGENLTLVREIYVNGRNVCSINGKNVSVNALKEIGATLIDIHGQHENQSLSRPESHIMLLDSFGGKELEELVASYSLKLAEYKNALKMLRALSGTPEARARNIDLLKYQIREIEAAELYEGEEDELEQRRVLLNNAEKIFAHLRNADSLISSGDTSCLGALHDAFIELSKISDLAPEYKELADKVESAYYDISELANIVYDKANKSEFDPNEAELISRRLDYIFNLKRKYGASYAMVMEFLANAKSELDFLEGSEENAQKLSEELASLSNELLKLSSDISEKRAKVAKILEKRIMEELSDLEMKNTEFRVNIEYSYETNEEGYPNFGLRGLDTVEFMISPNKGEPLKPMNRIASGGELSRISLAIKSVLSSSDSISTFIFDEIDTGVSGLAARAIAFRLKSIATRHQVICVTHLAQIAAAGEENIYISKSTDDSRTFTSAEILSPDRKILEIARLLDGNPDSDITKAHASELIQSMK